MKKIIIAMLMVIMTIGVGQAQLPSSFPPKSYPASILVVTDPGVAKYWDVKRIMYLGPGNGGHKFRVFGSANADHRAANVEMFYIRHDDKLQSAGAYFFPEVKKGDAFNFDIVSAFTGYAPKSFLGFMIKDDMFPAEDESTSENNKKNVILQNQSESDIINGVGTSSNSEEIRVSQILATLDSEKETGYQEATFPGGKVAMLKWFESKFKYLPDKVRKNLPSSATVHLRIDKDGSVWLGTVQCADNKDLARQIGYYIKEMPNWIPAKSNGEPISSEVNFPLNVK